MPRKALEPGLFDWLDVLPATDALKNIVALRSMHERGMLGGEVMPEDVHPKLDPASADLAHYFTLGMSLNYQRNSYTLWKSCTAAWDDPDDRWVFVPKSVSDRSIDELREVLVRHRIALQPIKHVQIWHTISNSLTSIYDGDVRVLFQRNLNRVSAIKQDIEANRGLFPYLAGPKICNYWLYVMLSYTALELVEKSALNVAPDTHVISASARLGLINVDQIKEQGIGVVVAQKWTEILEGTGLDPIDVHTPLWLWSRGGFIAIEHG